MGQQDSVGHQSSGTPLRLRCRWFLVSMNYEVVVATPGFIFNHGDGLFQRKNLFSSVCAAGGIDQGHKLSTS